MNNLTVKNVDVLGNTVMTAQENDGTIWVGIRWLCQGMGMSEGQYKNQIKNIQKDLFLKRGGLKLILPTNSGKQEVFCLKLDYLPIWLAKISITPTIQKEKPELVDKLLEYQLKAKDILAAAFMPKQKQLPMSTDEKIQLLAQGNVELKEEIQNVKEDIEAIKMDLPILPIDADRISNAARAKGVDVMGGKISTAYKSKSIRQNVYTDIYGSLKRQFGITGTYKKLKRSQCDMAVEIIQNYQLLMYLKEMIDKENGKRS